MHRFKTVNHLRLMLIPLALVGGGSLLQADVVVPGMGDSFTSWSTSILNTPFTGAYWNGHSGNGDPNIGGCLVGAGTCISGAPGNLPYLSDGSGGQPNAFTFSGANGQVNPTLMVALTTTNNQTLDEFGWYTVMNGTPSLNPLFDGSTANYTGTFTPGFANYGFYIQTTQGGVVYTFYTETAYNSASGGNSVDSLQHFALFDTVPGQANNYYLGIEDTPATIMSSGTNNPIIDYDYNDMVIHVVALPEPSTMGLLGGGMLLFLSVKILRKRVSVQS